VPNGDDDHDYYDDYDDDDDDDDVSLALVIQNAMRMRRVIFTSVACLVLLYFFILAHKWHDFRKKVTEYKIYILFSLQLLSETFLIVRKN